MSSFKTSIITFQQFVVQVAERTRSGPLLGSKFRLSENEDCDGHFSANHWSFQGEHNTAELYTQASNQGQLTEGECLCLMT